MRAVGLFVVLGKMRRSKDRGPGIEPAAFGKGIRLTVCWKGAGTVITR